MQRYRHTLVVVGLTAVPLILIQAALVPWYVPIAFGAKWIAAVPLTVLLCLSVVLRPLAETATQALRAAGRPGTDLLWNALTTALLVAGVVAAAPLGLAWCAAVVMVVNVFLALAFAGWTVGRLAPLAERPS